MSVVTDYPDYSPHVATASQIASTGVPLLTKSSRLYQQSIANVAPGAAASTGPLAVTQVGYEVLIGVQFANTTTNPFVEVHLAWTDSATGFVIATDTYYVPGATAAGGLQATGKGLTKGDTLTVTVTNMDGTNTVNLALTVLQNSRVYPRDLWSLVNTADNGLTVPSYVLATLPDDESVIGLMDGVNVPASGSSTFLCGIAYGLIGVSAHVNSGTGTNFNINIKAKPDSVYGTHFLMAAQNNPPATFQTWGVHAPLEVNLQNQATTALNVTCMLVALP